MPIFNIKNGMTLLIYGKHFTFNRMFILLNLSYPQEPFDPLRFG